MPLLLLFRFSALFCAVPIELEVFLNGEWELLD
jgi:hypothetical protein